MAWWGRRPRSLSSWHKGHCLSAKSSFLRPTSPPILCCTLKRSLILTRTTPYHAWRQASSLCTEAEKSLRDFFFFLRRIRLSGSSLARLLPTNLCPAVWAGLKFLSSPLKRYTGLCYLSQNRLRMFAPPPIPPFFLQHQQWINAQWLWCCGISTRRWMLWGPWGNMVTFT